VLRDRKREIIDLQMQLVRLEDKALKAQMNPHFIFNSLNSIKLLVQENENAKAIHYLTVFTRLMRGLLSQSDHNYVRLYDELEICRHYLELESLRFDDGFSYSIQVEDGIDLKSIEVPAMVLQPFVENAIWHGLMPKSDDRRLIISIQSVEDIIICRVNDNGIGRVASAELKANRSKHTSKGLQLATDRIHIYDKLNDSDTRLIIRDKYLPDGRAAGTEVEISFTLNG
jgi:sensor histidine kinase YesM